MTKFRIYFDKDKEVMWLNEMVAKGWAMTGFGFCVYHFEPCRPGEYLYQIDFGEGAFSVSEDYREFMSEAGVEIVGVWGPYVFLRRKAEEGAFELYTDVESIMEHYKKIRTMFKIGFILEALCLIMEALAGLVGGNPLGWVAALLILVAMTVFIRQIVRINGIVAELKERLGGEPERVPFGGRKPSLVLAAGMFFTSLSILIDNPSYDLVKHILQGVALVCLLAGMFLTCRKRESKEDMGGLYRVKGGKSFIGVWGFLCSVMAVWVIAEGLLHELGHCIAVWISGGKVTGFYPFFWDAHMSFEGIADSPFINISGSLLPILVALAVLLFYKRSEKFPWLNILAGVFCTTIYSLLAWVVVPLVYLFGFYDPGDDITKFLNGTGFHPAAVALAAAFCLGILWMLFLKKLSVFFGEFNKEKKIFMRVIWVSAFITCVAAMLVTLFSETPAENMAGKFRFTTGSGQQSILQEEYEIRIESAGKYILNFDCKISEDGVLVAVALCDDETSYYFSTGGIYLYTESKPLDLSSGNYTLSIYCITDEEEWEEFRGSVKGDVPEMDFLYQETDKVTFTGSYWIHPASADQ